MNSFIAVEEDLIPSPKAGPSIQSKKPTNQALKTGHRKKKGTSMPFYL